MTFDYELSEMEETIGGSLLDDLRAIVETDTGKPTSFDDGDVVFSIDGSRITAKIVATKTLYQLDLGTAELDEVDWDEMEWTRV
jgi:hypothetical protein